MSTLEVILLCVVGLLLLVVTALVYVVRKASEAGGHIIASGWHPLWIPGRKRENHER